MTINANPEKQEDPTGKKRRVLSLRARLLITFILAASLPVLLTGIVSGLINAQGLRTAAFEQLDSVVELKSTEITSWLSTLQTNLGLVMLDRVTLSQTSLIIEGTSSNLTQVSLREKFNQLNQATGYFDEIFIMDKDGKILLSSNKAQEGKISINQPYFSEGLKGAYIAPPTYDVSLTKYSIIFSRPIKDRAGQTLGVIAGRANLEVLNQIMVKRSGLGETGETYLIGSNYALLSNLRFQDASIGETYIRSDGTEAALEKKISGSAVYKDYRGASVLGSYRWLPELQVALIAEHDENEALRASNQAFITTLGLMLATILAAIGIAVLVTRSIINPIAELALIAQSVTVGNFNVSARVYREDEIGVLASAFNTMTARLRELIGSLEQRVAERTAKMERRNLDLALAAEVGQTVSQVREINSMLSDAAEIMRAFFGLYYVQVYLVSPDEKELILQFGTGSVGEELVNRKHRLPLNEHSINGRAAVTKRSVVISDTANNPIFKPNPLLPNTRSEIAVPLLVGNTLIGVLDVQSEKANQLNEETLLAFEPMSGQMAVAIQNARLVEETQHARAEVETLLRRLTRQSWSEYMDAIHKPEKIGFIYSQNEVTALAEVPSIGKDAISQPIAVSGEPIGALVVEVPPDQKGEKTNDLLNVVAEQVAAHIESLRLLETAERYRAESEAASRRSTREGWREYAERKGSSEIGYVYNLTEVKSHEDAALPSDVPTMELPLKIRDEQVGSLSILNLDKNDSEGMELASAVAERLTAHIENLRLSQQTFERAQREQILRQITSAVRGSTDPEVILRTAVRELGNIFGAKTMIRVKTKNEGEESPALENSGSEA